MSTQKNISLNVGEIYVGNDPAVVSTILGSCISVCLFVKDVAGGIIHYAMPQGAKDDESREPLRYGHIAIHKLVKDLSALTQLPPQHFEAKIVGGAVDTGSSFAVGEENIRMAHKILKEYGIRVVGESVGGEQGRKVIFHIPSGRLQVAKIESSQAATNSVPTKASPLKTASFKKEETPRYPRKVLIVDDSKTIRSLLTKVLSEDPQLQVIGAACDALEAATMLKKEKPDVITLDVHMPHMTGVEWLEKLLPTQPLPVVMISSLELKEGNEVFRALELGAIDYIQKPTLGALSEVGPLIREKVKSASFAKVVRAAAAKKSTAPKVFGPMDMRYILAIGASTGGTEALKSVLCALPKEIPPTVIVQHIPPVFSKAFADRVNQLCPFEVKEAEDGDEVRPSRVLIAPGATQMKLQRSKSGLIVRINDDPPMNRHKPSVDYLFHSVAAEVGNKALGVILTGMGADGAKGLLELRSKGCYTIGQDEETCVVYGMPRAAFEMGAVEQQAPLQDIAAYIVGRLSKKLSA